MHENHRREQYFWDGPTLAALAEALEPYSRPVLLCAPMLGQYLHEQGRTVVVLDTDRRFTELPGFRYWDIHRPEWLGFKPDLILCDPPFYSVKLDRLYRALMNLTGHDPCVPLTLSWLARRRHALLGTFARFDLQEVPFRPSYVTVPEEVGITTFSSPGGLFLDDIK